MALTRRQREVLEVIRALILKNGYSPSLEEIGRELNLSSVATVHKHVSHLVAKGFVRRVWNQNRSIELQEASEGPDVAAVPVRGTLRGGAPPLPPTTIETIRVPADLRASRSIAFALRVEGDGFEAEHVRDGDLLVIEDRRDPSSGDTVVAVLDGSDGAIGRWVAEGGQARLVRSGGTEPVEAGSRVTVVGVVTALVRRFPRVSHPIAAERPAAGRESH